MADERDAATNRFTHVMSSLRDGLTELEHLETQFEHMVDELRAGNENLQREGKNRALAEEQLRKFLDFSPDSMLIVDSNGRITYANSTAARTFGYAREELTDLRVESLLPERFRTNHAASREGYCRRPSLRPMGAGKDLWGLRKDGTEFPVEIGLSPFEDARQPYVLAAIRDVTERKRVEQELRTTEEQLRQSQKMEAIGQLAGGVAHDFNNLLTIIVGYSVALAEELPASDPRQRQVEQIRQAGERATELVRQLLAFSRKQILQPQVLDLNVIIARMDSMLRRLLGEDIDCVTNLAPRLGRVEVDPSQIEQIILNLAVNARDAMPQGGKLTIETANVELDEDYVRDHVLARVGPHVMVGMSDTGSGMDAETQRRIFEPFFTTKRIGNGTGLGLSTVYGIVKQSGGNIWVYSEPGYGTTFKVYLPRSDKVPAAERPPLGKAVPARGVGTILVVEDEPGVRGFVSEMLQLGGYTVLSTGDPEEAIELCRGHEGPIRLLLTDVVLPKVGGRQLAEALVATRPDMKVLYMSGYTDNAIVHRGVLKPGMAFIEKPMKPSVLLEKIREVLSS